MKKEYLGIIFIVILALCKISFAQDIQKALSIEKIVWLGVDFTEAKFVLVTEDPGKIVDQYLKAINTVIITEAEKFNIKKFFHKTEVINKTETAIERNLKIDPSQLVISNDNTLDPKVITKIIKDYNIKENNGTGLIFIAENLSKVSHLGSYYVCFFNLATKEIIDSRRLIGKAAGIGFRNYWAGSVYDAMKSWAEINN